MNVSIPDEELVGIVECLAFLIDFTRAEEAVLTEALARHLGICDIYDAVDLRADILECADYLAQAMGYPDADLDSGAPRPAERCR